MNNRIAVASILVLILLVAGCGKDVISSNRVTGNSVADLCVDNDDGLDYTQRSSVEYQGELFVDRCYDEDTVVEYYCKDNEKTGRKHICEHGCYDGMCAEVVEEVVLDDDGEEDVISNESILIDESSEDEIQQDIVKGDCKCTALFNPACGTDGLTYYNACHARCFKVGVAYKGQCGSTVDKPAEVDEINGTYACMKDSTTYFVKNKYVYYVEEDGRQRAYCSNGVFTRGFDTRKWVYNAYDDRSDSFYQDFLNEVDDVCQEVEDIPEDFDEFLVLYS